MNPDAIENNTTEQNSQQIQLLPCLSLRLPTKMTQKEIVTSNAIYETAHSILSRGMNEVSSRVLGFLSTSLRAAERADGSTPTRRGSAVARELLRRSGCLKDMLDMFVGTPTMANEHWKVLCQCLVDSCRNCEDNQNYCSCLIPVCVQRHDVMDIEILKLLHCLLLNNSNNINLFVKCNGIHIFTKETDHHSSKLELLSVVVQNSSAANLLKRDTQLVNSLIAVGEDYKVNCEGSWKMVECASVILFHLASHIKGLDNSMEMITDVSNSETTLKDLTVSFLFKPNWEKTKQRNVFSSFNEDYMSCGSSAVDFVPKYVSTPKRRIISTDEKHIPGRSHEHKNSTRPKRYFISKREAHGNKSGSLIKKTLSASARLFNIVNNSCISIYHTMGTILCRNPADTKSRSVSKRISNIEDGTKNKFTEAMKQQFFPHDVKITDKLNAQKQLTRKLAIRQKYRKGIVKKLKIGMYFYGCNFKKISQAMWSHETHMTPKVLYSIYKKCISK